MLLLETRSELGWVVELRNNEDNKDERLEGVFWLLLGIFGRNVGGRT
jgi:hypothetical protein